MSEDFVDSSPDTMDVVSEMTMPSPTPVAKGRSRLTVREDICFEPAEGGAVSLSSDPYSLVLKSDEEPVRRKFSVGKEWMDLPLCWAEEWETCSGLLLHVIPSRPTMNPEEGHTEPVVELAIFPSREGSDRTMHDDPLPTEPVVFSVVPIGMPVRIYPLILKDLKVRCVGTGSVKCQLVIIPS